MRSTDEPSRKARTGTAFSSMNSSRRFCLVSPMWFEISRCSSMECVLIWKGTIPSPWRPAGQTMAMSLVVRMVGHATCDGSVRWLRCSGQITAMLRYDRKNKMISKKAKSAIMPRCFSCFRQKLTISKLQLSLRLARFRQICSSY